MSTKERRALREGEWACTDPKCTEVNAERTLFCQACGRGWFLFFALKTTGPLAKPKPKARIGREIGKDAAEKSKGLFSADDWICTKFVLNFCCLIACKRMQIFFILIFRCGNVNWARRATCNICNAKKLGDTERRTGILT